MKITLNELKMLVKKLVKEGQNKNFSEQGGKRYDAVNNVFSINGEKVSKQEFMSSLRPIETVYVQTMLDYDFVTTPHLGADFKPNTIVKQEFTVKEGRNFGKKKIVREDTYNEETDLNKMAFLFEFLHDLSFNQKNDLKQLIYDFYQWNPDKGSIEDKQFIPYSARGRSTFTKKINGIRLFSMGDDKHQNYNELTINGIKYQFNGFTMDKLKNYLS